MNFNLREHHTETGFRNPEPDFEEKKLKDLIKWGLIDRLKGNRPVKPEQYSFRIDYQRDRFMKAHQSPFALTWVGHSSFLITINGINILTDPIWSDRCSPVQFIGPKRYVDPGIPFDDLPKIDIVLISHDHYDHLDVRTIKRLGNKPKYFIPLNLSTFFSKIGITNLSEHDWWSGDTFMNLRIISTPAQHFSGRTWTGRHKTLWCGWVIETPDFKMYFAGDSGYFSGFREIGRRFGSFDLALIPIGAYLPRWFMRPVHLSPGEAVQAYLDVNARYFIATHWGTFDLADEPLDDPAVKLKEEVLKRGLNLELFWTLQHGESRVLNLPAVKSSLSEKVSVEIVI